MEAAVVALLLMLPLHASAGTSALTTDPSDVTYRHQQHTTSRHYPSSTDHHRASSALHPPSLALLAPSAAGRPPPAGDQGRTSGDWPPDTTQRAGAARGRQTVVICTLLPYDPRWLFSMPRVGEALDVAVGKVLSGAEPLLTGVQIRVDYRDSRCSIDAGIKEAIDAFVTNTVDVFFGPCCDYSAAPVGRQVGPAYLRFLPLCSASFCFLSLCSTSFYFVLLPSALFCFLPLCLLPFTSLRYVLIPSALLEFRETSER